MLTPLETRQKRSPTVASGNLFLTGLTKAQIRSKILKQLKIQKEEDRNRKSKLIQDKLLRTKVFRQAKVVMFYVAFGGEVNTKEMIREAQRLGKLICVPIFRKNKEIMRPAVFVDHARLKKGPYGVLEPATEILVKPEDLDLIIVPGVAFDKKGNRLGRGKGCYDRFLSTLSDNASAIGLAFDFQILPLIPTTSNDISVKKVIFS